MPPESVPETHNVTPISLMTDSQGVVFIVLLLLLFAAFAVWVVWLLKTLQLKRLRQAQLDFEADASRVQVATDLVTVASQHRDAPGARVLLELAEQAKKPPVTTEILLSAAKRSIVREQQDASSLMPLLSSIASASPFVGLFGTVWGIMEAFIAIGVNKNASLPIVAPAIGEALIATAVGLVAAIPATIAYNFIDAKIQDLMSDLDSCSDLWVESLAAELKRSHS